jgi:hypothetical protein
MRSGPASAPRTAMLSAAAAAAAVLLAAGCGSGGGSSSNNGSHQAGTSQSAAQAITLAARQAGQVNSFASTMNVQTSGSVKATMVGTMQIRKQPSLLVDADFSTVSANGQNVPGGMQEILSGSTLYLKMATLAQQLGKPWASIQLSQLQQGTGVNLSELTQELQNNDPMTEAQMLTGASNLRSAGTQTIDGVAATHYTGTFTVAAGLAKLPPSTRGTEQKALQALGVRDIAFNAWIDAQHQIRKIEVTEHGSSVQVTATMQVTSLNQPIHVSPPPASQVKAIPAAALQS